MVKKLKHKGGKKMMDRELYTQMALLVVRNISEELKAEILESIEKLEVKAKETKNPFDDLGVILLKAFIRGD